MKYEILKYCQYSYVEASAWWIVLVVNRPCDESSSYETSMWWLVRWWIVPCWSFRMMNRPYDVASEWWTVRWWIVRMMNRPLMYNPMMKCPVMNRPRIKDYTFKYVVTRLDIIQILFIRCEHNMIIRISCINIIHSRFILTKSVIL